MGVRFEAKPFVVPTRRRSHWVRNSLLILGAIVAADEIAVNYELNKSSRGTIVIPPSGSVAPRVAQPETVPANTHPVLTHPAPHTQITLESGEAKSPLQHNLEKINSKINLQEVPKKPSVIIHSVPEQLTHSLAKKVAIKSSETFPLLPPITPDGDKLRKFFSENSDGYTFHEPSVSVDAIRQTLKDYNSPLIYLQFADGKDAAQYIWDSGRVLGVDPGVWMSIFFYESKFGTEGEATSTKNPGNVRPGPWCSAGVEDNYFSFDTWQEGIDCTYTYLIKYKTQLHLDHLSVILPVWAPWADNNNPDQYVLGTRHAMNAFSIISNNLQPGGFLQTYLQLEQAA